MRLPPGHEDDRDLALELARGVGALAKAGPPSQDGQADRDLELFLGLFHPEIDHPTRRRLVQGAAEDRRRRRARRIAQDARIRNAIRTAARRRSQ